MTAKSCHKSVTLHPICISIFGRELDELKAKIVRARSFNPQFLELRLDYLRKFLSEDLQSIQSLLNGNEIFTFRSSEEGGASPTDKITRFCYLKKILQTIRPPLMDIEIATLTETPKLMDEIDKTRTKLIASTHNFRRTEPLARLRKTIQSVPKIRSLYAVKIVQKAQTFEDNRKILSLYRLIGKEDPFSLIAFSVGELGIYSRLVCTEFGSPMTYASLPKERTAPGQLDVETMLSLFALNLKRSGK